MEAKVEVVFISSICWHNNWFVKGSFRSKAVVVILSGSGLDRWLDGEGDGG